MKLKRFSYFGFFTFSETPTPVAVAPKPKTSLVMLLAYLTPRGSPRRIFSLARLWLGLISVLSFSLLQAAETGTISGTVNNSATGNLLPGAKVEIAGLGVSVVADPTGSFVLTGIPSGTYDVAVSYTGLDPARSSVTVTAGQRAVRDFDLNSGVYTLGAVTVSGEREGNAAAITAQRNAANVKNVVAMDSFGNMPNMSAGEVAIRLPGVAAQLDGEGNVSGLIVRGQSSANNRVTVDGDLLATVASLSRQFQTHSLTGAMFDELEVIKGHTPDQPNDSTGGTINLKTRSMLAMKEKRRIGYSYSVKTAPAFTDQIPLRSGHRAYPQLNTSYQEVFSAFGGERNLGVALNFFYSENVQAGFNTTRDYQNTAAEPAYLFNWSSQDYFNNRKQASVNAKVEYRLSPATKLSFNLIYNDAFEPFNRLYTATVAAAQSIATLDASGNPTGTGAILPGFTDKVTQARGLASSTVTVNETMFSFKNRTRAVNLSGEHNYDRWRGDWTASFSRAHPTLGVGQGGTLSMNLTGVGWKLDRTKSEEYPTFTQTEGPDYRDIANYRPSTQLTARNSTRTSEVINFRGNLRYDLPLAQRASIKLGFDRREQVSGTTNKDQRWNYVGPTPTPFKTDPNIVTQMSRKTGFAPPRFETAAIIQGYKPADPTLWSEDQYFKNVQPFSQFRDLTETSSAAYAMVQGKFGRLGYLGGVRQERTEIEAFAYIRARVLSTTAQQTADPVGSAQRDYANNRTKIEGSYNSTSPSAHLSYDITQSLKARTSWSTGIGRAPFSNLFPAVTPNDANRTLTINNPGLKPQFNKEWDATLEYYFEPVGQLSVGWFHKDIRDQIVSGTDGGLVPTGANNGYNGDYADYQILTSSNEGNVTVNGWEFSYQQQFTFLPGMLRTLSFSANYTYLMTHSVLQDVYRKQSQTTGFIPETGNLNLSWRYRAFGARVRTNFHGKYITSYGGDNAPQRSIFRFARTVTDLGFSYRLRANTELSCDITNVTNEPQEFYRGVPSRLQNLSLHGVGVTLGVNGRF
ncbi:MAG: TonB-dependent receptor [Opitutaceae bacterium]